MSGQTPLLFRVERPTELQQHMTFVAAQDRQITGIEIDRALNELHRGGIVGRARQTARQRRRFTSGVFDLSKGTHPESTAADDAARTSARPGQPAINIENTAAMAA